VNLLFLTALLALNAHAVDATLAQEVVPQDEDQAKAQVTQLITEQVKAEAQQSGKAVRDAHAKAHGCVRANFIVNEKLPKELAQGVFSEGKTYPAWIRFSNGSGKSQNDKVGDGRGFAIKLIGVAGERVDSSEKSTQDFLMINHPTFFVRNASDYVEFSKASSKGNPLPFFFPSYNPINWRVHELNIAKTIQGKKVGNLLANQYWTMTPYLLGSGRAAKFSVRPCAPVSNKAINPESPNFLRETLSASLAKQSACFEFMVQTQTDSKAMPIEDPTIEWSEKLSPFVKVATIMISAQHFEGREQQTFCENLSLNPWHSLKAHRPLGGINRVRRQVYETISTLRHELNHESLNEPTGKEQFSEN